MRRIAFLAAALGLAAGACAFPPSSMERLQGSVNDYNQAIRFGRPDIASDFVREIARDEFTHQHASWGKTVIIADLEMNGVKIRRDGDADVTITVNWQRVDETSMRTTEVGQRWTSTRGIWNLLSEEERGGDKGLIGETIAPKEEAVPSAPSVKSHYQTRVIYEQ